MHYLDETHVFLFLVQLFILLLGTRGLGELFRRWRQPPLTAEILVGVLLGPTILGRFLPQAHQAIFPGDPTQQNMLETVAWIGVLFLLLETGLEIDFSIAWRQRGNALVIAVSDIVVPMALAFLAVLLVPDRYLVRVDQRIVFALFMATVMTISAMPVTARTLQALDLLKTDLGFLTMSALAVNDIIGWVLFTIILGLFTRATMELQSVLLVLVTTVGFAALVLGWGRRLSSFALKAMKKAGFPEPGSSLTFACLVGVLFGATTQRLGIHALFGFFLAGVAVGESRDLSEQSRGVISQMVHAIFVPLFFANIGLKLDFAQGFDPWLVGGITGVGIIGRYLGAWLGVTLARVPRVNRDLIAIGHIPGGMMEIVVALLALEAGLIGQPVFVAIVFGALFSSVVIGPWMSHALARRRAVSPMDFMGPELVALDLRAGNREEAIRELAELVAAKSRGISLDRLVETVTTREHDFGTALGSGVAIPHCRMEDLTDPLLAFGRSAEGLEWDSPDGEAVHAVFLLATPAGTKDLHVQILAKLARAMHDPATRTAIARADSHTGLFETMRKALSS